MEERSRLLLVGYVFSNFTLIDFEHNMKINANVHNFMN